MKNPNFFLVCLDDTPLDDAIIKHGAMWASLMQCNKVTFVHFSTDEPVLKLQKSFDEKINRLFTASCAWDVVVREAKSVSAILKWKNLDLTDIIIMGMKPKTESTGKHAAQVINAVSCSVMLVPVNAHQKLSKVILPLDFSKNALDALAAAMNIRARSGIDIILHHVYFVPTGYSHTGKTYEEMAAIMQKNKIKEYERFKQQYELDDSGYELIYELDNDQNPSDNIYGMAKKCQTDLIIVATRGRTKLAALLKPSKAVKLIHYDRDIPCLIVRNQKEAMGFWEALTKV